MYKQQTFTTHNCTLIISANTRHQTYLMRWWGISQTVLFMANAGVHVCPFYTNRDYPLSPLC